MAVPIDSYIQAGDVIHCFSSADLPPPNIFLDVQDNCMVVGYPMGFHDNVHNFPIKRVGTIASPYGADFSRDGTSSPLFLLDATLHPGTSGSPVILPPTTTRRIFDGAIIRQTIGKSHYQLLGVNSGAYTGLNLNMVWYAELIQEIVPPTPAPPSPQPSH
jgi:hypothetical protein